MPPIWVAHYIAIAGDEEMQNSTLNLKDLVSGEQEALSIPEIVKRLK